MTFWGHFIRLADNKNQFETNLVLQTWSNDTHFGLFATFLKMTLNDLMGRTIFFRPRIHKGQ